MCANASYDTSMSRITEIAIVACRSTAAYHKPVECVLYKSSTRWTIRGYLYTIVVWRWSCITEYFLVIVHLLHANKLYLIADFIVLVLSNVIKIYPNLPRAKYADVMISISFLFIVLVQSHLHPHSFIASQLLILQKLDAILSRLGLFINLLKKRSPAEEMISGTKMRLIIHIWGSLWQLIIGNNFCFFDKCQNMHDSMFWVIDWNGFTKKNPISIGEAVKNCGKRVDSNNMKARRKHQLSNFSMPLSFIPLTTLLPQIFISFVSVEHKRI